MKYIASRPSSARRSAGRMAPSRLPTWGLPVGLMPVSTRDGTSWVSHVSGAASRVAAAGLPFSPMKFVLALLAAPALGACVDMDDHGPPVVGTSGDVQTAPGDY